MSNVLKGPKEMKATHRVGMHTRTDRSETDDSELMSRFKGMKVRFEVGESIAKEM